VKAAAGNDSGIGEPEIEEIAIDQQAISEIGHRLQEFEQCLLGTWRRHSEVGVGHDHEGMAEHGAKDGVAPTGVQQYLS
jgi:hypothetical protein